MKELSIFVDESGDFGEYLSYTRGVSTKFVMKL